MYEIMEDKTFVEAMKFTGNGHYSIANLIAQLLVFDFSGGVVYYLKGL